MSTGEEKAEEQLSEEETETDCESCGAEEPDPDEEEERRRQEAIDTHDNIEQYEGRDYEDVERDLDERLRDNGGWEKKPLKRGDGARYNSPDGNRQVRINRGYPEGRYQGPSDGIHNGPYVSTPSNGTRIPLASNPFLGM